MAELKRDKGEKMKSKVMLAVAAMALSLGLISAPASWANSLTFQGVTFNLTQLDSNSLSLNIVGAASTTNPNWADVVTLKNFFIRDIGTIGAGAAATSAGWTSSGLQLNANGCAGGGSGGFCFTSNLVAGVPVTDDMTFNVDFTNVTFGNWNTTSPHLMVRFFDIEGQKEGSLLSQDIPSTSVPEPTSLMLLGAGLVGLGILRRKLA